MTRHSPRRGFFAFLLGGLIFLGAVAPGVEAAAGKAGPRGARARNVILMVADGGGFNSWVATAMYEGAVGREFYRSPGWVALATDTYPLRGFRDPGIRPDLGLVQFPDLVYDPAKAWSGLAVDGEWGGFPFYFAGYMWLRRAPDSACTATAMATGLRTFPGALNVDGLGRPIENTVARLAHRSGRRVGVVTSVPLSHATPAAFGGAHQVSRGEYAAIALEMLGGTDLDVIAGCGHPEFDNNGRRMASAAARDYRWVGGKAMWSYLTGARIPGAGDTVSGSGAGARVLSASEATALGRWTLVETKTDIEALASGATPARLLMVPQVGNVALFDGRPEALGTWDVAVGGSLQQTRGSALDPQFTAPGDDPFLETVPSLAALTRAALNALDDEPRGFFLHVEGGAVDWAMHAHEMGRMIEEMQDFERAVDAVVTWVEGHGGWKETLLLITADHDHLLWGPRSDVIPFDPLRDNGAGNLPSYRWLSGSHSAALVPFFARGPGAEGFVARAAGTDPFRGPYLPQTEVFEIMKAALGE